MKILVVDDSSIIRRAIQKYVSGLGKDVEIVAEAGDGLEALALFKEKKPDVVTMDITMPNMDGLTSMTEMLKINPDASIVVISALSDRATALDALDKGAAGFVGKPFTQESLWEALEPVLNGAG